jgi:hypothetical protein
MANVGQPLDEVFTEFEPAPLSITTALPWRDW